jgi:dihydrofolate synthase/folylpolyglutamate synthase
VLGEAMPEELEVFKQRTDALGSLLTVVDQSVELPYPVALHGEHQQRNARTVLATTSILAERGWRIEPQHEREGLANVVKNTGLMGRWQVLGSKPAVVADVAHNIDGMTVLLREVDRTDHARLHIVIGTVNDKDLARVLAVLPTAASYYFCKADIPRGLAAEELAEKARAHGLTGEVYPTVRSAYSAALDAATPADLVLVTGSVFVVAEVM